MPSAGVEARLQQESTAQQNENSEEINEPSKPTASSSDQGNC